MDVSLQQLRNKMTRGTAAATLTVAVRLEMEKKWASGNQTENAASAYSLMLDRLPNC